jgi:hypothetical protein
MDEPSEPVALAYAPLPPVRPGSLTASNPIPALAELRGPVEEVASLPVPPLPPPRPDARPVVVASAGPVDIPVTGSTTKTTAKDAKPQKPAAAPEAKAPSNAKKPPATALSTLMSTEPSLHMGFTPKATGELATNRFSGPAVKPLPVVR